MNIRISIKTVAFDWVNTARNKI